MGGCLLFSRKGREMTILEMLDKLVLGPIGLLLDVVYHLSLSVTNNYGRSIIVLSLFVNLLLLPLYRRADAMQKEERDRILRMKPRIDQIKSKFTGNERFLILQTYYRQCHYKPYYALKGSVSLLLQIPFFMAAYRFLSGLQVLKGVPFGPIHDLSLPDGMLQIGGIVINVLPILMTLINIISGMLYSKGMPLKSKIQMYGLAAVFLVLLYNSPSGLVFYWTLNNLFSLGKNILSRILHKDETAGAAAAPKAKPRKPEWGASWITPGQCKGIFWFSSAFLVVLTGLLIPSAVIKSSTEEFLDIRYLLNPSRYLLHTFLLAAGFFLLWCGIYFWLSGNRAKRFFAGAFASLAVAAAANFMLFGTDYGDLSSQLKYENTVTIASGQKWLNLLMILGIIAVVVLLIRKFPGALRAICLASCIALLGVSVMNMSAIQTNFRKSEALAEEVSSQNAPEIRLSKTGKNVVVLMLDRAVGKFVPFLMNEKPELMQKFDGFTYYPNTLSYGFHTISASPALYGGYEYVPDKIMERADEKLVDKHNEALKVMPVLFRDHGFDVTVIDQSLANYKGTADLTIYKDYPDIHTYNAEGYFTIDLEGTIRSMDKIRNRNLFCYSIFRISPLVLQMGVYDNGGYNETDAGMATIDALKEKTNEEYVMENDPLFMHRYLVMQNLTAMTSIQNDSKDFFLVLANEVTHNVTWLQEPDYVLAADPNNSAYEAEHGIRVAPDGSTLDVGNGDEWVQKHYQCNMLAFLQLGRWFDYLKANGVWDNTRIIIVSDHSRYLGVLGYDLIEKYPDVEHFGKINGEVWTETVAYVPMLLVKDFGAKGYKTDKTFMTNGDTPVLAMEGLIDHPVNPFTGNPITSDAKNEGDLHLYETDWHFEDETGNVFVDPQIITFRGDDIDNIDNWLIER